MAAPHTASLETLAGHTAAVLGELAGAASRFTLPEPPAPFLTARERLHRPGYTVVVAGEAKRGKSTFVNALIGRLILPTGVDVTTAQVFRVSRAETETFRVRFTDGSAVAITADDLGRYGTQQAADAREAPTGPPVAHLEIDVPAAFLPPGIAVLDTPGLGSLYAPHAGITERCLPTADAVVVVLDSESPIGEAELAFVERVAGFTRNLFFVQSRIDLFGAEHWKAVRTRTQHLLGERLRGLGIAPTVWPVSALNLLKAGVTGDPDRLLVSRYPALADALQRFLSRVSGVGRVADGLLAAEAFHTRNRATLDTRKAELTAAGVRDRAEAERAAAERKRRFDAEWGPRGRATAELQAELRRTVELARQQFRQILQANGEIERAMRTRIQAIQTVAEANEIGPALVAEVAGRAEAAWADTRHRLEGRLADLLRPFLAEVGELPAPDARTLAAGETDTHVADGWWDRLKAARGEATTVTWLVGALTVALPFTAFLTVPATLAALPVGLQLGEARLVDQARRELLAKVAEERARAWSHFFEVNQAEGRFSLADEYFEAVTRVIEERVRATVATRLAEFDDETARLAELARVSERDRGERLKQADAQTRAWDVLGNRIHALVQELKALEAALN